MRLDQITVYQFIDSKSVGGIETHILNVSHWLVTNGYQAHVLFYRDYGETHPLENKLTEANIPFTKLTSITGLMSCLKRRRCLLATHGYKAGLIGRMIGQVMSIPVVSTFHSGDRGFGRVRFYSSLDELTARFANQVICVSQEIQQRLHGNATLIPNFVPHHNLPLSTGHQIAFVGRLSHEKGPDLFAEITREIPNADAHVYGDGPMRSSLSETALHLCFHGNVSMEQHWQNIGLLCITSRFEGLPLVVLEAMARGIPVVSFDVGALSNVIQHGVNGWIVDKGDFVGFEGAVERWLSMPAADRIAIGSACRAIISRKYSSDIVCPKIVDIYCKAVKAAPIYRISSDEGVT